jgi:uncharacterized membrane protein (DUF485 family)
VNTDESPPISGLPISPRQHIAKRFEQVAAILMTTTFVVSLLNLMIVCIALTVGGSLGIRLAAAGAVMLNVVIATAALSVAFAIATMYLRRSHSLRLDDKSS